MRVFNSFSFTRHYRSGNTVTYFSNSRIYRDSSPALNCYLEIKRSLYVKSCSHCQKPYSLLSWLEWEIWINLFQIPSIMWVSIDSRTPTALSLSHKNSDFEYRPFESLGLYVAVCYLILSLSPSCKRHQPSSLSPSDI